MIPSVLGNLGLHVLLAVGALGAKLITNGTDIIP